MSTLLSTTRIIVIEYLESHYKKKVASDYSNI